MSSFYDDASLVVIPSGYKTSKVYAEKPTDGSGDLAFTRTGDTATRVNSAGLIEKVRTNLLTYSQDFTNAAWTKSNVSATGGQNDPNGGTTASLIQTTTAASAYFYQVQTGAKAFSIYAKAGTRSSFAIINGLYNQGAGFNLATQTVTNAGAGSLGEIESVGGGWYRCSVYVSSSTEFIVSLSDVSGGGMTIGDNLTFAFAQAETGDIATDYIPTTTAAVTVGPVANVPRLDYLGSTCGKLLLEPQRTNLVTYSEQMDNASWIKLNGAVTANAAVSPDGYTNADKFVPNTTSGIHALRSNLFNQSATAAHSWFVKADGYSKVAVRESELVGNYASFNLATGTLISTNQTGSIVNYGNGWYRLTLVDTTTGANAQTSIVVLPDSYTTGDPLFNWSGDGTKGVLAYGAMVELGAYATSYIPTIGAASATRGADACSKTGISSLLNSSQGTIFLEVERIGPSGDSTENLIFISDTSVNNFVNIIFDTSTSRYRAQVREGGVTTGLVNATSAYTGSIKIAIAYAANDLVLYINGVQQGIDTSVTIPSATFNSLGLGGVFDGTYFDRFRGDYSQALLFKTRLTNAQMQELTTL